MDNKAIGECIRFHRRKKGLTQAELAEKVGASENLIGCYERGTAAPGRYTLFALSALLDFSIDALIKGADYSGCAIFPDEMAELFNKLSLPQRKVVMSTLKTMINAILENSSGG